MTTRLLLWSALPLFAILWYSTTIPPSYVADESEAVADVLLALGDQPQPHYPDTTIAGVSVERGRDLVLRGISSKPGGGQTGKQSQHFVCTACHNVEREDPDLRVSDPQARLLYARDNGLPFLQGTTLYGAVDRTQFYNGDYQKKYGDLVKPARNNLREAIQLCAIECSQGRRLEPWELESVLAYLWTIGLKMGDLDLGQAAYAEINQSLSRKTKKESAIALVKAQYLSGSPATFVDPPADRKAGYAVEGDAENGQLVYELSCMHCHEDQRYSFYNLDDSDFSLEHLAKHAPRYTRYSIYQVGRYGTSPMPGKRAYMPNYTAQKLSNQQMEDLRAYLEQERSR